MIGIQRVSDDHEAIALMNDTDYGLTAAVYSSERARAVGIATFLQPRGWHLRKG